MNIIAEYDQNNQLTTKYVQGPRIDEHLSMQRSGNVWYYHTDGLGSVTAMTDPAGTVVQTYSYDSFGNIGSQTGSLQQPYTYTGREYDPETGLYYYRARYYDTITGKFISKDPIGLAGGINLYAYVGNNPVNWTDPTGEMFWMPIIVIGVPIIIGEINLIYWALHPPSICPPGQTCIQKPPDPTPAVGGRPVTLPPNTTPVRPPTAPPAICR